MLWESNVYLFTTKLSSSLQYMNTYVFKCTTTYSYNFRNFVYKTLHGI
uniref:Uncharacterized protein n=1 Tax=Meloidogyne enterolobii TaxID=390850 RepID=A0A6V7U9A3_MELEN|nr:unnamed protein product [Meloidogyne enterolobii]